MKEVRSGLGIVVYICCFYDAYITKNLCELMKKDVSFGLNDSHLRDISMLKKLVTEAPVLKIFDPELPTKVS